MEWNDAWQLSGLICDMMHAGGIETTAQQHEKIAGIIFDRRNQRWNDHRQEWADKPAPKDPAVDKARLQADVLKDLLQQNFEQAAKDEDESDGRLYIVHEHFADDPEADQSFYGLTRAEVVARYPWADWLIVADDVKITARIDLAQVIIEQAFC